MIGALNLEVNDMLLMAGIGYYMYMHRRISLVESVVISVVVLLIKNYLLDNSLTEQIGEEVEGLMSSSNGIIETLSNGLKGLMGNNHVGGSSCRNNNKYEHLDEQNNFNPEMTGGDDHFPMNHNGDSLLDELEFDELELELEQMGGDDHLPNTSNIPNVSNGPNVYNGPKRFQWS